MAGSMISRRMSISAWKGRSLGSAAKNRSSNWPAGVDQSISPAHQVSVEGMFAWANAQEIERLLDKPVAHFGVPAEAARQSLVSWAHPPRLLADQKPGSQSRLAPRPVRSFSNAAHHLTDTTASADPWQSSRRRFAAKGGLRFSDCYW